MSGWNLPPGVTADMIPGNERPKKSAKCLLCNGLGYTWAQPVDGKMPRQHKCVRCGGRRREPQSGSEE